eukprot:g21630.t1
MELEQSTSLGVVSGKKENEMKIISSLGLVCHLLASESPLVLTATYKPVNLNNSRDDGGKVFHVQPQEMQVEKKLKERRSEPGQLAAWPVRLAFIEASAGGLSLSITWYIQVSNSAIEFVLRGRFQISGQISD